MCPQLSISLPNHTQEKDKLKLAGMRYFDMNSISRSSSCESTQSTTTIIDPAAFGRSTSYVDISDLDYAEELYHRTVVHGGPTPTAVAATAAFRRLDRNRGGSAVVSFLRSLLSLIPFPSSLLPTCTRPANSIAPSLGRRVTGTLFGNRRGAVSFAVQYDPRSPPAFVVELAVSTAALVKEMSAGRLRIALECEKPGAGRRLFGEPVWRMYCNGRQCGAAHVRECNETDWHVLSTVQRVSVGAGVIPVVEECCGKSGGGEGELVYMRARFERVVGNRDSEAFYMLNPDGNGGPELGIFLLRI